MKERKMALPSTAELKHVAAQGPGYSAGDPCSHRRRGERQGPHHERSDVLLLDDPQPRRSDLRAQGGDVVLSVGGGGRGGGRAEVGEEQQPGGPQHPADLGQESLDARMAWEDSTLITASKDSAGKGRLCASAARKSSPLRP